MQWIQNVSISDIKSARHFEAGKNSMLIQICDPAYQFPVPMHKFKEVHQFEFLDVENKDQLLHEFAITQDQADRLVELLQRALDNQMNVVVHCHAGVCRSGAVCEVGVMMGFTDTLAFRAPNLMVKHLMMKRLGWLYDEQELHTINGAVVLEDWDNDNEKVFTLAAARREHRMKKNETD